MSVTPYDETLDTSLLDIKSRKYPNPFFDLANNFIPKNIKTLFKFCKEFFHTNSFLHNVVTKLTEYPITDILYDTTISKETKQKYNSVLHEKLKIKSFLIETGLDYFTYGNSFTSIMLIPKRFLTCTSCKESTLIENVKFKLTNFEFFGTCPICKKQHVQFKAEDEHIKSVNNFKLVRWAPENIDIDYNPITGSSRYYYNIPNKIKAQILIGNETILRDIPLVFLESLKQKKRIEIDPGNIFHLKFPTLAEEDMGWGKPMILPALKDIYYLQTLKRGNEAICNEHIIPKKTISPANTATMDPFTQMNLGKWRSEIETTISKWRQDPNYIAVMPIPIQYQEMGGNARMLMTTPEMRMLEENIINSLGVPLEFIKGGTSWTGSSISLRIVENHFLNYRERLLDLLNFFIIPKLTGELGYPDIKVSFKKFKMADDSESKQLAINLNAQGKISDSKLLDEFGYDYEEEKSALQKSRADMINDQILEQERQAKAQGCGQVIMAQYQARAQQAMKDEEFRIKMEILEDEIATENSSIPEDVYKLIDKYALQIFNLPQEMQQMKLQELGNKSPVTYGMVIEKIKQYQLEFLQKQSQMMQMGGPPPVPGPPEQQNNRSGEKNIKPRDQEKTKGQTRGTP